jgi:hypothetical protein
VWLGTARLGKARAVFSGQRVTPLSGANRTTWRGQVWPGMARQGLARHGMAWSFTQRQRLQSVAAII